VKPPASFTAQQRATFTAGARVVAQSGCLFCHTLGANGNSGPGPDLTHIGSLLPAQGIASTLINPTAPMPSFKNLPPQKFQAVVGFLSELQ
jgi:ubiquinol-cytochrome c reductase cytochrome b subunit/menaquinol-cytochrome c reductase cytochrome b/c subunit